VLGCWQFYEVQEGTAPRFIDYDYQQTVMLPVVFDQQILPGTFEYSLYYLVDKKLDLRIFIIGSKTMPEGDLLTIPSFS
jgi:hypothetical protein